MIFCCPACGGALERRESALVCPKGHSFDVARQGYVHLLPVKQMHAKVPGDTKQMVDARRRFLALGHYDAFRDTLRRLVSEHLPQGGTVLDAGCGEGFYTAALAEAALEKNGRTAGIDISKFAVKAAAGRHKGIDFAVASLFHIPCAAESVDVLTDVFAPIVPAEFHRVLKPGGTMILAVPGARREITVEGAENIEALFSMTPYYWKTDVAGGERLRRLNTLETEIKFRFLVYRRR